MALTTNEQTLLDILTSMETESTLDDISKAQLIKLRELANKPDTASGNSPCECPACIFNNLVYPDGLDEEERFKFAINTLVQSFVKKQKDEMYALLESVESTSPEAKELIKAQKEFYERIINGKALHDNILISYNDFVKQFESNNIENYFDIINKELDTKEMVKHVLNLDIQNMENFLLHYSRCQHKVFIAAIVTMKYIERGVTAAKICLKLNQPYDKAHFLSHVYGLEIQHDRIMKISLMLPTKNKDSKMSMESIDFPEDY